MGARLDSWVIDINYNTILELPHHMMEALLWLDDRQLVYFPSLEDEQFDYSLDEFTLTNFIVGKCSQQKLLWVLHLCIIDTHIDSNKIHYVCWLPHL